MTVDNAKLRHGDIINVRSNDVCCGLDRTVFTAIVIDVTGKGLRVIPQDFIAHMINCDEVHFVEFGINVEWLLDQDVIIRLLYRVGEGIQNEIIDWSDEE